MYLDYWKLSRNPFDNVPDPHMYFSEHATVESTVSELLFAVEEGNECLAVVAGDVGLGKTMSLRMVLNELDQDKYRIAYVTNPDVTFNQLLRDIVGQLEGERCEIKNREGLLEEFNNLLFRTSDENRKVLVFIDEGNALRSSNLEGLRLLTNMQEDDRNLFTLIIAGQPKLTKMLRDPRRANIFQRIGVFCNLEPMDSTEVVKSYIEHRLIMAGCKEPVFDDSGYEAVFERSSGIPRLVNRLCKLSLKAAETNALEYINGELVHQLADRFSPLEKGKARVSQEVEKEQNIKNTDNLKEFPRTLQARQRVIDKDSHSPGVQPAAWPSRNLQELEELENAVAEASPETLGQGESVHSEKKKIQLMGVTRKSIFQLKDLSNPRDKLRFAGLLAARELKINPERFEGIDSDPVRIWDDLRRAIIEAV